MMCGHESNALVNVLIPGDLSYTGLDRWKLVAVDACIAPIVAALQAGGINMRGSCCGHGERSGEILLADGRVLIMQDGGGWDGPTDSI